MSRAPMSCSLSAPLTARRFTGEARRHREVGAAARRLWGRRRVRPGRRVAVGEVHLSVAMTRDDVLQIVRGICLGLFISVALHYCAG
jgi:hypothetical protein